MKVLALDPALRNTGIAFADYESDTGLRVANISTIVTKKEGKRSSEDDLRCAVEISKGIEQAIAVFRPSVVVSEIPHGAQSSRAGWALGIVIGLLAGIKTPLITMTPTTVKKRFVGQASAKKQAMVEEAVSRFPDLGWVRVGKKGRLSVEKNEHMADAVAVAVAATFEDEFLRYYADWVMENVA